MKTSILLFLLCSSLFVQAQDDLKNDDLFYSISFGLGIGKSPNFEKGEYGTGGMVDFFSKILHDYSDKRKGFVIWKDLLEEQIV